MTTLQIIFWIALAVVFYTYVGYGLLLRTVVGLKGRQQPLPMPDPLPRVTLFITAWNEEAVVEQKVRDCRALNYPTELLDIVWVTDGSTDRTNELLALHANMRVLFVPERRGKCAAMNRGMEFIATPITVFTDANTMLNPEAIAEMVRPFSDPACGCVAGEKRVSSDTTDGAAAGGEGFYWRYESKLKQWDSQVGNCVGAAGELFALRTELFAPLPTDTLLDDFTLSLRIAAEGHRVVYAPAATATERASADMRAEQKRKIRIAAGGLQAIWRLRQLLNPRGHALLTFQYVSHRVLRWTVTPVLFFALLPMGLILAQSGTLYFGLMVAQVLFYLLAVAGYVLQNRGVRVKLLFVPYYVVFMNWNVFRGAVYLFGHRGTGTWERAARSAG